MTFAPALETYSAITSWLGITTTLQDIVKAFLLILFALGVLMILGDIYRGEIQNTLYRILTVRRADHTKQVGIPRFRRSKHELDGKIMEVPMDLIPPTLDSIHSNVFVFLAYTDVTGKRRLSRLDTFEVKFLVRKQAFRIGTNSQFPDDHKTRFSPDGSLDEEDLKLPHYISLAASRVDYITERRKALVEKLEHEEKTLRESRFRRWRRALTLSQVRTPAQEGIVVKFHFPINPWFLLYKHPDREVKMTAWLTVLTSLFAIMTELIF